MCVCVWSVLLNAWCSSFSFAHNGSFLMWQCIVCMFEILSQRLRVSAHHQNQNCCCQASWLHLCIARRGYRSSNSETSKQKRSMLLYSFGKACGMFLDGISWMHCKVCECGVTKNADKKISTWLAHLQSIHLYRFVRSLDLFSRLKGMVQRQGHFSCEGFRLLLDMFDNHVRSQTRCPRLNGTKMNLDCYAEQPGLLFRRILRQICSFASDKLWKFAAWPMDSHGFSPCQVVLSIKEARFSQLEPLDLAWNDLGTHDISWYSLIICLFIFLYMCMCIHIIMMYRHIHL